MPRRGAALYWKKSCDSSSWLISSLAAGYRDDVCLSRWTFLLAGCGVTLTTTRARCLPTPPALMYRLSAEHWSLMLMLLGDRRKVVLILVTDWHERHNSVLNVKPDHLSAPYWLAAGEPINPQWRGFKAGFSRYLVGVSCWSLIILRSWDYYLSFKCVFWLKPLIISCLSFERSHLSRGITESLHAHRQHNTFFHRKHNDFLLKQMD